MEQLAQLILNGEFEAGEQLPPERELAAQFEVARGPVREALRALALVGLVEIKPGHGVFARDPSAPTTGMSVMDMVLHEVADIRDVYQARKVIETEQIIHAAQKATPDQVEQLKTLMVEMRRVQEEDPSHTEEFANLHYQFDLFVAEAAGNQVLLEIFRSIRRLEMETHLKVLRLPEAMANSIVQQDRILEAIVAHDPDAAKEAARLHFESIDTLLEGWLEDGSLSG
jgi:DNA-binding FadR family transcriptional regulator